MRLYVLARNYQDFLAWCWRRNIPSAQATYVANADRLHGAVLTPNQIVMVPGCEDNINHAAIMEQVYLRLAVSA